MTKLRNRSESPIPLWLDPDALPHLRTPEPCSDNKHGRMTADHIETRWPLPTMFGSEEYSFSLIDIPDQRFREEAAVMSRKLIRLFYDLQIIEFEWRKTYKLFVDAENRKDHLTPGVLQKSRDKAEAELEAARDQLLRLQDQRDLFKSVIGKIWDRCDQIQATIRKEHELECLRDELSQAVRNKFPPNDPFWKTKFKVRLMSQSLPPGKHHNYSKHK